MAEAARIEELRRRVDKDPASLAFAQLADELRRAGDLSEAVRVCRAGLQHHPEYLAARVTLGRALASLNRLDEASAELSTVVRAAPDNLAALRALDEIRQEQPSSRSADAATGAAGPDTAAPPSSMGGRPGNGAVSINSRHARQIQALERWLHRIRLARDAGSGNRTP